jgi:hypothetical protein
MDYFKDRFVGNICPYLICQRPLLDLCIRMMVGSGRSTFSAFLTGLYELGHRFHFFSTSIRLLELQTPETSKFGDRCNNCCQQG